MKQVRSLVSTVLAYGDEDCTLKTTDDKRIESAELWIYRRMLQVSGLNIEQMKVSTQYQTASGICCTSQTLLLLAHAQRGRVRACEVLDPGEVSGNRRRGRPNTSYNSNITKWMTESNERITRGTRDRADWRRLVRFAARAADRHS